MHVHFMECIVLPRLAWQVVSCKVRLSELDLITSKCNIQYPGTIWLWQLLLGHWVLPWKFLCNHHLSSFTRSTALSDMSLTIIIYLCNVSRLKKQISGAHISINYGSESIDSNIGLMLSDTKLFMVSCWLRTSTYESQSQSELNKKICNIGINEAIFLTVDFC